MGVISLIFNFIFEGVSSLVKFVAAIFIICFLCSKFSTPPKINNETVNIVKNNWYCVKVKNFDTQKRDIIQFINQEKMRINNTEYTYYFINYLDAKYESIGGFEIYAKNCDTGEVKRIRFSNSSEENTFGQQYLKEQKITASKTQKIIPVNYKTWNNRQKKLPTLSCMEREVLENFKTHISPSYRVM